MRVRVSQPLAPLPSCKLSCGAFRRIARLPLARVRDDRLRMSPPTCRRAGRRHAGLVIHRTGPHATLLSASAPPAPQTEPGPDGFALKDTFGRTDARFKDNFFLPGKGEKEKERLLLVLQLVRCSFTPTVLFLLRRGTSKVSSYKVVRLAADHSPGEEACAAMVVVDDLPIVDPNGETFDVIDDFVPPSDACKSTLRLSMLDAGKAKGSAQHLRRRKQEEMVVVDGGGGGGGGGVGQTPIRRRRRQEGDGEEAASCHTPLACRPDISD